MSPSWHYKQLHHKAKNLLSLRSILQKVIAVLGFWWWWFLSSFMFFLLSLAGNLMWLLVSDAYRLCRKSPDTSIS